MTACFPIGASPAADARIIDLFCELAPIEGLSGQERAIADYVHGFVNNVGLRVREEPVAPGTGENTGNLLTIYGERPRLALLAHMDTARSTRGTTPVRTEERIASDGTAPLGVDNRAGMAILLRILELVSAGKLRASPFCVAFTTSEETTLAGSQRLQLPSSVEMAVVFDSSLRPGNVITASYGAARFEVTIEGRPAHAGLAPEKGINAIAAAGRALGVLPQGRLDDITTANVGRIEGGTAVNVVCDRVRLDGEIRSQSPEQVATRLDEFRRIFEESCGQIGAGVIFTSSWEFQPYTVAPERAVFRRVAHAISEAGLRLTPCVSAGGSDANSLNARGFETVNLGIGAQNPHSNAEFILIEDLQRSLEIAAHLVRG